MEAEVREILTQAARLPHIGLLNVAREVGGVGELPVPTRDVVARVASFE